MSLTCYKRAHRISAYMGRFFVVVPVTDMDPENSASCLGFLVILGHHVAAQWYAIMAVVDFAAPAAVGCEFCGVQEQVSVVGYPTGGDNTSITSGVVSRVEVTLYVHAASHLMAIQIDAAINPGGTPHSPL